MINIKRFIIIDNDEVSTTLTKFAINKGVQGVEIEIFKNPAPALEYIATEYFETEAIIPTIILLEITNGTEGWDFVEAMSHLPEAMSRHFIVYVLSASIHETDRQRALSYPVIQEYLEKPLASETVRRIFFFNKDLKKFHIATRFPKTR